MKKIVIANLVFCFFLTKSPMFVEGGGHVHFKSCGDLFNGFIELKKAKEGRVSDLFESAFYVGYVTASAARYSEQVFDRTKKMSGFPKDIIVQQIAYVFGKFLEDNPAIHHGSAATCFSMAMLEAFPKYAYAD